jgi:hypothetical protein
MFENFVVPKDLMPSDPRFGVGPSLIPVESVENLAKTGNSLLGTSHRKLAVRNLVKEVQDGLRNYFHLPKNFGTGVIAVTVPNNFSGKKIAGAVILINDSGTFGNLSRNDQIAVLAHEMGHALGLGHSEDDAALMYYRTIDLRSNLGQDDIDGISYLYPMHVDAFGLFGGFCGTISDNKTPPGDSPFLPMVITLGSFILILELVKLLRRPKARSAA